MAVLSKPRVNVKTTLPKFAYQSISMPPTPNAQGQSPGNVTQPPPPGTSGVRAVLRKKTKKAVLPRYSSDPNVAQIEMTRDRHVGQAKGAAAWLASVVGAITNASNLQSAQLNSNIGMSANAYQAAGQMTGPAIMGPSGMGVVGQMAPTPALANSQASVAATGLLRNDLSRAGLTDVGTSLIAGANRYATTLPSVYQDKINSYLTDLREFNEKIRQFNLTQTNRLNIANAEQAGMNARTQAQIDAANARANQTDSRIRDIAAAQLEVKQQGATGSYAGLAPKDYQKLRDKWTARTFDQLHKLDKDGKNTVDPKEAFDAAVTANIRPSDALRMVNAVVKFSPEDMQEVYSWLTSYLPGANASAVMRQVLGRDAGGLASGAAGPPVPLDYKPENAPKYKWVVGREYVKKYGGKGAISRKKGRVMGKTVWLFQVPK